MNRFNFKNKNTGSETLTTLNRRVPGLTERIPGLASYIIFYGKKTVKVVHEHNDAEVVYFVRAAIHSLKQMNVLFEYYIYGNALKLTQFIDRMDYMNKKKVK